MMDDNVNEQACPSRDAVDGIAYMTVLVVRVRPYTRHPVITGRCKWVGRSTEVTADSLGWASWGRRLLCRGILGRGRAIKVTGNDLLW